MTNLCIIISCLCLAAPSEEIISLMKGEQYVAPVDGAFVSKNKAHQIRETCDKHKIEAHLCKEELQKKEQNSLWWIIPVSLLLGFSAGWGMRFIK